MNGPALLSGLETIARWVVAHIRGAGFASVIGGLTGALLSPLFVFWVDQRRLRGEVAVTVVEWTQDAYRSLEVLRVQKSAAFQGRTDLMRSEDLRLASEDLRRRLLHDALRARVAVAFGDGEELRLLNTVQAILRVVVTNAWKVQTVVDWGKYQEEVEPRMQELDRTRQALEARLVRRARLPWILRKL